MPDTGRFVIQAFQACYAGNGSINRITALTLTCRHCEATTSAAEGDLIHLPGGTLFKCGRCNSHQAVSNARVSECVLPALKVA